jgi:homoserine kinase
MKSSVIKVFAPATVANVAVGFDILGFAIHGPGDEVWVKKSDRPGGLQITQITGTGEKRLPLEPEKNTAGFAALELLRHLGKSDMGIDMEIHKQMPFGSGLGSSAASAAAGVMAINELLGCPLDKLALLPFAVAGEQIADGAYHADNVGPSLLGGITFIRDNQSLDTHQLPVPSNLYASVVYPYVEILTKDSRNILSKSNLLSQTIQQTGNLGALIIGLYESDYNLISRALNDVIIEPQRAKLIPNFTAVKKAAIDNGALGSSISGAGPSCFAFCEGKEIAAQVALAMQQAFAAVGVDSETYVSKINIQGCIRI